MKRILTIIFFILVSFSFVYGKGKVVLTMACMPPEGTMDEEAKTAYVTAVEAAFIKKEKIISLS